MGFLGRRIFQGRKGFQVQILVGFDGFETGIELGPFVLQ